MINEFEHFIKYSCEYINNLVLKCQVLNLVQRIIFSDIYDIFTYNSVLCTNG